MTTETEDGFAVALMTSVVLLEIALGIAPKADRFTWAMENMPVWIGLGVWLATRQRFQLSKLCICLLAVHALVLMVGGYYTYSEVPLGNWVKHGLGLARNDY